MGASALDRELDIDCDRAQRLASSIDVQQVDAS